MNGKKNYLKFGRKFMDKEKIGKWEFSKEDFLRDLREATKRGEESLSREPRAESATFDGELVIIRLSNGSIFGFLPGQIKELQNASSEEISRVTVNSLGTALHWDELDAHYTISGLLNGVFGTKAWMQELGRRGGSRTSAAKADAASRNGEKGGRPRRSKSSDSLA